MSLQSISRGDSMSSVIHFSRVTSFLQQVAQAVAQVLDLEVTITDSFYNRVAGTGEYKDLIGVKVSPTTSFGNVLKTREPVVILEPRKDPLCKECEARLRCKEECHISYPLLFEGKPIGVLALIGFEERQRLKMEEDSQKYLLFLKQMSLLIVSAVKIQESMEEAQQARNQLQGVVNSLGQGLLAVDESGRVICCNQSAASILGSIPEEIINRPLESITPKDPILETLKTGRGTNNREVSIDVGKKVVSYISTSTPLRSEGRALGAVGLLENLDRVHQMAYNISSLHPDLNLDNIIGDHHSIIATREKAYRAAAKGSNILIRGESGTGKELFARAIHFHSRRSSAPFVSVNCAAIPEDLLESELFGYEEGAFTGARKGGKPGKFRLAHGGTLFLDEVADCSLRLQAKLLRVLDTGEIQRIGSTRIFHVDVWSIAATNKNLEQMIENSEFREDLYYRLNVIPLKIPPLRDRISDIPILFEHFLKKHASDKDAFPLLSKAAEKVFFSYSWPGNVRELENVAQYVLSECAHTTIDIPHLPQRMLVNPLKKKVSPEEEGFSWVMPVSEWERRAIKEGLRRLRKMPRAKDILAKQLGMGRTTLYRKIKEYGLE